MGLYSLTMPACKPAKATKGSSFVEMFGLNAFVLFKQPKMVIFFLFAMLLGADEIGFATAPLIAAGCIMMRKCHLNTCPVGVATQDPELRKRFKGQPEHVINFFFFVAEELRGLMAAMGIKTLEELVGCTEWLDTKKAISHWKAKGLDFTKLFAKADVTGPIATRRMTAQDHGLDKILDRKLIAEAMKKVFSKNKIKSESYISTVNNKGAIILK